LGSGTPHFGIRPAQPAMSAGNGGSIFDTPDRTPLGADGKFRVCDLYPGIFRLAASARSGQSSQLALHTLTLTNQDLRNLQIATPSLNLEGEGALDGPQPRTPVTARLNVSATPLGRPSFEGEGRGARAEIPGTFQLTNLVPSDYGLRVNGNFQGLYVKD